MGNAGHCTCSGGCLHGLRRSDLQSSEEETRQKGVGSHRGCCIWGAILAVILIARTPMPL